MGQNAGSCCAEACCEDAEKNAFGRGVPPPVYFAEDLPEALQTTDRYVHSSFTEENSQHGPACMEVSGLASVAATSPSRSPPLREDALRRTSTPYTFTARQDRLEQEAQLYVDTEIARSVSLVSTLQGFGWLWRVRPERMSHVQLDALWKTSTEADAYDVFLSHTWATPGHLKYLSLLLSSCWHQAFLAWALAAVLVMALYVLNLLPLPLRIPRNENLVTSGEASWAPWGYLLTFAFALSGLVCAPHICSRLRQAPWCFYDVACVNQANPEHRERGIYGIGGFLTITKQLRILWSPPYLSRLWCVPFPLIQQLLLWEQ